MKTIKVLFGNITFLDYPQDNDLTKEEQELFTTSNIRKALIHEIEEVKYFDNMEQAYEEVDNTHYLSWLIPIEYNGEIRHENPIINALNDSFNCTRDNFTPLYNIQDFKDEYGTNEVNDIVKEKTNNQ